MKPFQNGCGNLLIKDYEELVETHAYTETETESKLNYTKLNNIFNLIIDNNPEKIGMTESAFRGFKLILKKLDLIVTQDFLKQLSRKQILEYKVIYYSLIELWNSSFVMYLYKITRDELFHKLYKTEENLGLLNEISEDDLEGFVGYFITCLQNIMNGRD